MDSRSIFLHQVKTLSAMGGHGHKLPSAGLVDRVFLIGTDRTGKSVLSLGPGRKGAKAKVEANW